MGGSIWADCLPTHFNDILVAIRYDRSLIEHKIVRKLVADEIDTTKNIPPDCRRAVGLLRFGLTDYWTTKI